MNNKLQQCPICSLENQKILAERDHGDKVTYDCLRCGRYTIPQAAETIAKQKEKSAELSGWLRERNLLGIEIPMLTPSFLEDVIKKPTQL
ncbi:MAG: hypothetical protein J7J52_05075 [Deltaproteobacteria bacterium]|nr:hypothetical protein [Deltaproteobacteria bacterium]